MRGNRTVAQNLHSHHPGNEDLHDFLACRRNNLITLIVDYLVSTAIVTVVCSELPVMDTEIPRLSLVAANTVAPLA